MPPSHDERSSRIVLRGCGSSYHASSKVTSSPFSLCFLCVLCVANGQLLALLVTLHETNLEAVSTTSRVAGGCEASESFVKSGFAPTCYRAEGHDNDGRCVLNEGCNEVVPSATDCVLFDQVTRPCDFVGVSFCDFVDDSFEDVPEDPRKHTN